MSGVTGEPVDDHPDGPDFIRDLVWGTALQNMELVDEPPEEFLFERPEQRWGCITTDEKLDAVVRREDESNN